MKKNFRILLFYPNEPLLGIVPINLAILSACLKNDGFDVKLFDCTIYKPKDVETNDQLREKLGHVKKTNIDSYIFPKEIDIYEDFIKTIEDYKPNLIGFNLIDSTIKFVLPFIEKIKHKKIHIVSGGVGSTFNYKKILDTGLFDFACIGEGEGAFVELANRLYNGEDTTNIRNIYTKGDNGTIIKNLLRPLVNLNDLPMPDFSIYEDWRFYRPFRGKVVRMLNIDTDRGCPFSCTYCAAPILRNIYECNGNYFRIKSIDKIFEELNYLVKKYRITFLSFQSETFLAAPLKQFRIFAERYKKEINLPFTCQSRLDTFTDEKTKLLVEMGCKNTSVGLEHGSEKIRQTLLNKKLSNESIIKSIKTIDKYGIEPTINNMIGLPDETRENVFETIELNREVTSLLKGYYGLNNFIFIPFAGTKLRQICIDKGYITGEEDIPLSFFKESLLTMPSMSKEEIQGLEKTMAFYILLPKSYWPDIKIAEQNNKEGEKMFNKLIEIKNFYLHDSNSNS